MDQNQSMTGIILFILQALRYTLKRITLWVLQKIKLEINKEIKLKIP